MHPQDWSTWLTQVRFSYPHRDDERTSNAVVAVLHAYVRAFQGVPASAAAAAQDEWIRTETSRPTPAGLREKANAIVRAARERIWLERPLAATPDQDAPHPWRDDGMTEAELAERRVNAQQLVAASGLRTDEGGQIMPSQQAPAAEEPEPPVRRMSDADIRLLMKSNPRWEGKPIDAWTDEDFTEWRRKNGVKP